jgi:hypothetical protein
MDLTHPVSLLREDTRLCIASAPRFMKVTHLYLWTKRAD